jgi:hypothetical protein
MRRRLADHLGTIEDALRFRLEWLGEYERQERPHYGPGEWETMCADLNAALERVQGEIATSTRSQPGERHPEYHGDTYRHFYTLSNKPAIIHVVKVEGGYGANVDFGDGSPRPLRTADAMRMLWSAPGRVLDLWQADVRQGTDGIDAAIERAEAFASPVRPA